MSHEQTWQWEELKKSEWGEGPWESEPDKIQWIDDATDLDCLIVRNHFGALCGYVGVPPEHPWHGLSYGAFEDIEVHGGLTFAAKCQEGQEEGRGVCHVPLEGRPADVWWFGFDCNHAFDLAPKMLYLERQNGMYPFPGETYRDVAYVKKECARLADEVAQATL